MAESKEVMQKMVNELANISLMSAQVHQGFLDEDLMNATQIFSHFLLDIVYTQNKHLPEDKMLELGETTGKALRELILSTTGKDMHDIVRNYIETK